MSNADMGQPERRQTPAMTDCVQSATCEPLQRTTLLEKVVFGIVWAVATLAVMFTVDSSKTVLVDGLLVAGLFWMCCASYYLYVYVHRPNRRRAIRTTLVTTQTNAPLANVSAAAAPAIPGEVAELQAALVNRDVVLEAQSAELRRIRVHADEAQRARGALLAEISREIRTPLTTILGFADLLLCETLPDSQREVLLTIRRNGEQLVKILHDVLELAQLEAGRVEIDVLPCSPRQIATDVVALTRQRAAEKGLELEFEADDDLPNLVRLDPSRCRQILLNLVYNAIKFTVTGRVTLGVKYDTTDNSALVWTVRDTGPGIEPGRLARLFQVRWQPGDQLTPEHHRPALGLAVCKELTERLGGTIDVESTVGQGTEFRVRLPAPAAEDDPLARRTLPLAQQNYGAERSPSSPLDGRRVLLAEDGPDNRRLFATVLTRAGASISLAEDGQVACQLLEAELAHGQPFDLVVIDMQMPVCDGYLATQRMRALGYRGPIVALTASSLAADRDRCLAVGCDDYLCKPVDFRQLIDTLAMRCDKNVSTTRLAVAAV